MPGLAQKLEDAGVAWRNVLDGADRQRALVAAPLLFAIAADGKSRVSDTVLDWLGEHGEYASSIVLKRSEIKLDRLTALLHERLDATLANGSLVVLRYFDPRVLEALGNVLREDQLSWLLAPASSWWFARRDGKVAALASPPASHKPSDQRMLLDETKEFALLEASEPDQIAQQLKRNLPELYSGITPNQRHAFIVRQQQIGYGLGIRSTRDLAMFSSLALMLGEEFHAVPAWRNLLSEVADGTIDFVDTVAEMTGDEPPMPQSAEQYSTL